MAQHSCHSVRVAVPLHPRGGTPGADPAAWFRSVVLEHSNAIAVRGGVLSGIVPSSPLSLLGGVVMGPFPLGERTMATDNLRRTRSRARSTCRTAQSGA